MSESEVVFRVVDRAGNLHRLKAARLVPGDERMVVFRNAAREEVAIFVEPVAVTLDSAQCLEQPMMVPGEACTTFIQSNNGMPQVVLWLVSGSLAALVVMRACELFGLVG